MEEARRHVGTKARSEGEGSEGSVNSLSPDPSSVPSCLRAYVPSCLTFNRPPPLTKSLIFALLCSYMVLVVFPLFWLLYSSFKADRDIFLHPFELPTQLHYENFRNAWTGAHFDDFFINSVIVTLTSVIVTTFLAAMTA